MAGRRSPLDGRTLLVCVLVAAVAAAAAGLVTSLVTDDGSPAGRGRLTAARSVPTGTFERFDGTEASLADYRGQPIVVNFWQSTCLPCIDEMPDLQEIHTTLGDAVAFVGINPRDNAGDARALAERTGVTYDLVHDPDGDLARGFDVAIMPTTALVLPDGTIADTIHGPISAERLCEKIGQSLLGGTPTAC